MYYDIEHAMFALACKLPELAVATCNIHVATFRLGTALCRRPECSIASKVRHETSTTFNIFNIIVIVGFP